jgi:hypothetical protein
MPKCLMRFEVARQVIVVLYVRSLLHLAVSTSQADREPTWAVPLIVELPAVERDKFSSVERADA